MPSRFFPPTERAAPDGLIAIGGELTVEWLLDAYRYGIFPWPIYEEDPMLWWSPDPRAVLPLNGLHISHRVQRRLRAGEFTTTCDRDFAGVIRGCSEGPGREGGTWLTPAMIDAYCELHRQGHAHSAECWRDGELVGGTYGISLGGLFAAESMFYRARDASKVALAHLVGHLNERGYQLLDVQQWTPHTSTLGVVPISRKDYLKRLNEVVDLPVTFN